MVPLVVDFLAQEFPGQEIDSLITPMMTVLHSHRYKKPEDFIAGLDFSIIWNLVQSYSQEARVEFMENISYARLFSHFCLLRTSQLEVDSQGKTKANWQYVLEIENELKSLQVEATETLRRVF